MKIVGSRIALGIFLAATSLGFAETSKKNVLLVAGRPSHGPGAHEHNAGVQLFAKCLKEGASEQVNVDFTLGGKWPSEEQLKWADTILLYSDGGSGHVAMGHFEELRAQIKRGCGLICVHYAVEPAYVPDNWPEFVVKEDGKPGVQDVFNPNRSSMGEGASVLKEGLGGYFEQYWSVNPQWNANFSNLPKHPISNGVEPFGTYDEWYYRMRFSDGMKGVTPILSDVPPEATAMRGMGSHSGNPEQKQEVLDKKRQHVAWAVDRADGGRGFGFTGGHHHSGWGNPSQRKLVLNAILWTAKAEVPATGVESRVTEEDLSQNLDPKPAARPKSAL